MLAAAVLMQVALGAVYAWSLFGDAIGPHGRGVFRLSPTQAAIPFEVAIGMIFLGAFIGGRIQDRRGPRVAALTGGTIYAGGVLIASCADRPEKFWLLVAGYGVLSGFGLGMAYIVPLPTLQKWFPRRRSLTTALAVAGFGFGGVLTGVLARPLLAHYATVPTAAFGPLGLVYLVMLLIGGAVLRNPPPSPTVPGSTQLEPDRAPLSGHSTREALRTRQWYLLTAILTVNVAVTIGMIATAASSGAAIALLSPAQTAALVSGIAIFNGAGRVVWALISERIGRMRTFATMFAVEGACLIALPHVSAVGFFCLAFLVGLCCGGGFGVLPTTVGEIFGLSHAGAIYGLMLIGWSIGGAAGPLLASTLIDSGSAQAGFSAAYLLLGCMALAAIALPLAVRPLPGRSRPTTSGHHIGAVEQVPG